jgi:nicotinate phosphoribosyltransferase
VTTVHSAGPERFGLFADLYELTMAEAYLAEGRADDLATFDLFVRHLPPQRELLVVAGVETTLERLSAFSYGPDDLAYLESLELFSPAFLQHLAGLRFEGEVRAMDEGELVFAAEPLLTVTAPLITAQLVETLLLNTIGFETMVASAAARITMVARGRRFVDFSARRDHGVDAAIRAARAACVGGAAGTSLVEAGKRYGLAVTGTMAHSYVMAHPQEEAAFRAFLRRFGPRSVLLVDTYDTVEGCRRAVAAMDAEGVEARGIRIDSGDLGALAQACRDVLDEGGHPGVQILVSGDLDAHTVAALVASGAPIDSFGVGTRLGTSADAPYLGVVYKLVEQAGRPRVKTSPGKQSLPGRKQVWRCDGVDVIALDHEAGPPSGRPLLQPVWLGTAPTRPPEPVSAARARCLAALERWTGTAPAVWISDALAALSDEAAGVRAGGPRPGGAGQ